MRRVRLLPSALLALSACTPGGGAPPPLAAPFELQVGFSPGGLADTISITALDRLPLHAAELIAPDGAAAPANWIDVNARPRAATGQWVANSPWETALAGTGAAALASPNAEANAALRSQVQVLAVLSRAADDRRDPGLLIQPGLAGEGDRRRRVGAGQAARQRLGGRTRIGQKRWHLDDCFRLDGGVGKDRPHARYEIGRDESVDARLQRG